MLRLFSGVIFLSIRGLGMAIFTGRADAHNRGLLFCSKLPSLLEALEEWERETLLLRLRRELSTFRILPEPD
jgi:hypothetical protein